MRKILLTFSLLSWLPLAAGADIQAGEQQISLNLGYGLPLSNIDITNVGGGTVKAGSGGFSGGGQFLFDVLPSLGLGLDFNFLNTSASTSSSFIGGTNTSSSFQSAVMLAMGRFNLMSKGRFIPYLIAGFGFHSTTLNMDSQPQPGFVWGNSGTAESRNIMNDNSSGFAAAGGVGTDFYLNEDIFLGMEGRYQYLGSATYNTSPQGQLSTGLNSVSGSISVFEVLARIGYKFNLLAPPPAERHPRRSHVVPA